MATAKERLLAMAVARGMLEPDDAHATDLDQLVASGRLSEADRGILEQDLADLDLAPASHWSTEITASTRTDSEWSLTRTDTSAPRPAAPEEVLAPPSGFKPGGIFRAKQLDRWARFESLELLGEGGMGRIFRATDPRLCREVALKLLRRDDPELLQRFIQEAQLQARVDHPNVCRVYEVGEWRGQSYIAMQYLRGATLKQAAPTLPLEALLRHMVEVCEGVHAAHRVGLVHRDLKPANLMIDRLEDGSTRACVLDFGLARGVEGGGLTETGHVMGTVAYMSPEQARGQTALLDRRSDVYSLGATLHALLTGEPPFAGDGLACMARIVKDEPVPLRRLLPTVPADLETVVLTCLHKDPRHRYATARALGEDLQRLLDGEPIQARPATALERLVRWVRKRKALVAAASAVLLSVLVFGGLAVRERVRASAQAAHAQRFAQAAERIEALARYLRLQPARDLTRDQSDLHARVDALAREVQVAGAQAEAPGAYALGRAHLALDDPSGARSQLERAWGLGFHSPEAAHALGRALASIYQVELEKAYALPDADLRQRRVEALKTTLRVPAADWLRRGASASLEPPAFRAGLLLLMEGRPQEAVRLAREAQAQAPWFYESLRLEAEAWLAQTHGAATAAEAEPAIQTAGQLLAAAEARAPCDVDLLRLDMRRWQETIALGWQSGSDPKIPVLAQVAVADRWAVLEPAAALPLAWRARARGEMARYLAQHEIALGDWLLLAKADATEALRRSSSEVEACAALASVVRTEALGMSGQGEALIARLREAIAIADRGLQLDPGHIVLMNIRSAAIIGWINAARVEGTYHRELAAPFIEEARALAASHPEEAYYQGNLGGVAQAMARAEVVIGGDPTPDAELAASAYESGLKAQPQHVGMYRGILIARAAQAYGLARRGGDPGTVVEMARRVFMRAERAKVPLATLAPYFMDALLSAAEHAITQHQNPYPWLQEASHLTYHLVRGSEDPLASGTVRLRFMALVLQTGFQPRPAGICESGGSLAQGLLGLKPVDPDFWIALAQFQEACGQTAAAARSRGRCKPQHLRRKPI